MLVIVCGPPCSGKSTIAAALASRLGFPHLEIDRIRARLLPGSDLREEDRDAGYRCIHLIAEEMIRAQVSVILDATYGREIHRKEIGQIINSIGVVTFLIQCKVPPDVALERFRQRPAGHPAVDLTEERVASLISEFVYSPEGIVIDTTRSIDDCIAEIQANYPMLFMEGWRT
ncbi:MAG: ATP-binding protein [Acidobacteria bacterium]|nr:ATP-binding protein [Acidobacteriota bacterium]